jgi:hypothetical protein
MVKTFSYLLIINQLLSCSEFPVTVEGWKQRGLPRQMVFWTEPVRGSVHLIHRVTCKKKLTYIMIEVEVDNSLACIFTSATVGANLFHQTTGAGKVHLRL